MVQTLLSLPELPKPDHAADALAVAICHANGAPLQAALERVSRMIALVRVRSRSAAATTSSCSAPASATA